MILFDGCSYTFGGELENPEKDAFPHLVSRMGLMKGAKPRKYRSIAKCGKSNDGILRTTLDFCEKNPVSRAIIQFTVYSRREIFEERKNGYFFISAQNNDEGSVEYYKNFQNVSDDVANFHKNRFILENYFQKRNIKYYFLELQRREDIVGYKPSSWYNLVSHSPITNFRDILGKMKYNEEKFIGGHPSKLGHELIARHLYENIF